MGGSLSGESSAGGDGLRPQQCSETAAGDSGLGGGVKFRQIVLGGEITGIMSAKHVETSDCECVT